jgi:uncharacterized protein HemX
MTEEIIIEKALENPTANSISRDPLFILALAFCVAFIGAVYVYIHYNNRQKEKEEAIKKTEQNDVYEKLNGNVNVLMQNVEKSDREQKAILNRISENQKETTHTLQAITNVLTKQSTMLDLMWNKKE